MTVSQVAFMGYSHNCDISLIYLQIVVSRYSQKLRCMTGIAGTQAKQASCGLVLQFFIDKVKAQ